DPGRRLPPQEPARLGAEPLLLLGLLLLAGDLPARRRLLGALPPAAARGAAPQPERKRLLVRRRRGGPAGGGELHPRHERARPRGGVPLPAHLPARRGADGEGERLTRFSGAGGAVRARGANLSGALVRGAWAFPVAVDPLVLIAPATHG